MPIPPNRPQRATDKGATQSELRNFGWEALASYGSIAAALLTTVLVYNQLGASRFGVYAGTLALAMLVGPFASVGFGQVLLRDAASGSISVKTAVERGGAVFGLGISIATLTLIALSPWIISAASLGTVVLLITSELIFGRLIVVARQISRAAGNSREASLPQLISRFGRTVAALLFVASGSQSLTWWAVAHFLADGVAVVVGFLTIRAVLGATPKSFDRPTLTYAREGMLYSFNGSAAGIKNDADKAMLAGYGFTEAAGAYSVAYRILNAAIQPLTAVLNASVTRFFRAGRETPELMTNLAARYTIATATYGALTGVAIWVGAPLFVALLSEDEIDPTSIIRALAVLPLLVALQQFAARGLTATNRQIWATRLVVASAAVNIGLNIYLIPRFTWRGAVAATIVTDLALGIGLWVALIFTRPKASRSSADRAS